MAFSGLLALLDDISAIADDVATLAMAASKKTSGLVTDDMAVTAEQAMGIRRERELPVVWEVARGSLFNKAVILVPAALALNAVAPWALTPILMAGGLYLSFEGVEKILHKLQHPADHVKTHGKPRAKVDPEAFERMRVRGAIRTDLILSAEIVAITLGEVAAASFGVQVGVLYLVALVMTVGVYGIVALLVRLDDIGAALVAREGSMAGLGRLILAGTPHLMKGISWVGTIAMLLVGGHIILHGIPPVEHWVHDLIVGWSLPEWGESLAGTASDFLTGLLSGGVAAGIMATGIPDRIWAALPLPGRAEAAEGH